MTNGCICTKLDEREKIDDPNDTMMKMYEIWIWVRTSLQPIIIFLRMFRNFDICDMLY